MRGFQPDRRFANSLDIYAIGAIALLYSHATAALVLAALIVTALLYLVETGAPRSQVLAFLFANVIVGPARQPGDHGAGNAGEIAEPGMDAADGRGVAAGGAALPDGVADGALRCHGLGARGVVVDRTWHGVGNPGGARRGGAARIRDRLGYALLVLFPLVFMVLVCGISVFRPILIPRITVWMVVPVAVVAAFAFTSPRTKRMRPVVIGLMACCLLLGLFDTNFAAPRHNPDWRAVVAEARTTLPPDTLLVMGPHAGPLGMLYYGDAAITDRVRLWKPPPGHHETNAEWLERTCRTRGRCPPCSSRKRSAPASR